MFTKVTAVAVSSKVNASNFLPGFVKLAHQMLSAKYCADVELCHRHLKMFQPDNGNLKTLTLDIRDL